MIDEDISSIEEELKNDNTKKSKIWSNPASVNKKFQNILIEILKALIIIFITIVILLIFFKKKRYFD